MPGCTRDRERVARRLLREASLELARLRCVRGAYRTTWRRIARARRRLALAAALLAAGSVPEPAAAIDPLFRLGFRFDDSLFFFGIYPDPTFADLDGDGDSDLLVGTSSGSTIFVENSGTPNDPVLGPMSLNPFGLANVFDGGASPALADIDGDGDLDAFIGEGSGNTIFFRNTGTATAPAFASPSTNPFGLADAGTRASLDFADVDDDGDLDAFVGNLAGDTVFFQNSGTASAAAFAAPATNPFGLARVAGYSASPALADVDGDGDLDLFVGAVSTIFFENTGTAGGPAFAPPATNPFGLSNVGSFYHFPAFADGDGDGDLDAVVGAYAGDFFSDLQAFENTGTASAPAFALSPASPADLGAVASYASPALGDIDGDGDLDALVGDEYGSTIFLRNTGTASAPAFRSTNPVLGGGSTNPFGLADVGSFSSPQFADINGDGDLDAFVGDEYGSTIFFENTGTASAPAFALPSTSPFGLADVDFYASPAFADIDGDGDLDALVGARSGVTVFFANTGTANAPAFAAPSTSPFGLADVGLRAAPALADLDGDGDLDALVGARSGVTVFFANTGTANAPAFAAPSTHPFGLADVGSFASPDLADIDGDGDLDAFVGASFAFGGASFGRVFFFENLAIDAEACTDALDNDGDGRVDLGGDPGCASAADPSELAALQCDNGQDDDGDGEVDWRGDGSGDPECVSLRDDREAPLPPDASCGFGPELLLLGPLLAARRRRSRFSEPSANR